MLANVLEEFSRYNINNIERLMIYFKADVPRELDWLLRSKYTDDRLYIGFDKRKVYVMLSVFDEPRYFEASTVRKKLKIVNGVVRIL